MNCNKKSCHMRKVHIVTYYKILIDWDCWYVYSPSFILDVISILKTNEYKYKYSSTNSIQHCHCKKLPMIFFFLFFSIINKKGLYLKRFLAYNLFLNLSFRRILFFLTIIARSFSLIRYSTSTSIFIIYAGMWQQISYEIAYHNNCLVPQVQLS